MEEPQTWQELLRSVISDPLEHQRIAREMGVNQITLTRWINRTSTPRLASLRSLLDAMPQHRQKMLSQLQKDFPKFSLENPLEEEVVAEIPAAFYANIMNIYTTSPPILRSSAICITIFQQMLRHLDAAKLGLQVVIYLCIPPDEGEKVHSLYVTQGRATRPWESVIDSDVAFLGLESLAGNAVSSGHPIITQSNKERMQRYPAHVIPYAESVAAYPLLYFDRIAGAVGIVSTQQNYFTPAHIELMQSYTELLILAFEPEQFYPLNDIDLGIMPSRQEQDPYLEKFQMEVAAMMLEADRKGQRLRRVDAEMRVWKNLEKRLLQRRDF